ncbi:MAG: DUF255 domain-containing protein [Flavobacteriaceae bacterium]|jgi:thioredoxin-related protein|nr:DUF255 domain-containing protein [Flavobacteriaceae bacterium]
MISSAYCRFKILFLLAPFFLFSQQKTEDLVQWKTIQQADSLQQAGDKRLLYVDVYTDWCGPCKMMDKDTFRNQKVADYLNENFIPVKFNAETKETVAFKGRIHKYIDSGRSGINALSFFLLNGSVRYPSGALVDTYGNTIIVIAGYFEPQTFLPGIAEVKEQVQKFLNARENQP